MNTPNRQRITVNGIVQGVGFRPFASRLALRHNLSGFVANTSHGVLIEIQGNPDSTTLFIRELSEQVPAPAIIHELFVATIASNNDSDFTIVPSDNAGSASTAVCPDLATCDECLQELFDPSNRRYLYPFINCTHCGPRFTIINSIPYDRPATTMASFSMCSQCQAEYDDPGNRRFHAQPNACPECGPQAQFSFCDSNGSISTEKIDLFSAVADILEQGKILAIKGLGGFHLAVDAENETAVQRLRIRKGRQDKPFAIMVSDLAMAHTICSLTPYDETILASCQRPILLAPRKIFSAVCQGVAPSLREIGLMLPYTPLHHLIFKTYRKPLVMTSGNRSEEPLCVSNESAFLQLNEISDAFVTHNRDIVCRADDSVVMTSHSNQGILLRRSRGYAPAPIMIDCDGPQVLAVGAELKNAICLLKGKYALLSQHLGDLKNLDSASFFRETISRQLTLFAATPELVVHDLHPGYISSRWAQEENALPILAVQHHHAHLAACLAENHYPGPAIGVILDGTGYGPDGTIWGGEILVGDFSGCTRYAFLEPMPLPGGEIAIREPWRTGIGYLATVFGSDMPKLHFMEGHNWQPVAEITRKGISSPWTSSCGRLFDAVAAIAGGRQFITYEAQAAIEMMHSADHATTRSYEIDLQQTEKGCMMMISPMLRQIVGDILKGTEFPVISAVFHHTLIKIISQTVLLAAQESNIKTVALSGGVFANRLLLVGLRDSLTAKGFSVLSHSQTPPGDGCVALGQALIGRHNTLRQFL